VAVAASSFGQGQIGFKTGNKNLVYSATDGTTASLAVVPSSGLVGSFGTVSYEILTAPSTTAPLSAPLQPGVTPVGWTATAVGSVVYTQNGAVSLTTFTAPANSGAAGVNVEMEVVAFTGTYANPTLFGYSGMTVFGAASPGLLSWSEPTGNPNATPQPGLPGTIPVGAAGLGSIILEQVPEPSSIALGGLAAASLLAFRRRK